MSFTLEGDEAVDDIDVNLTGGQALIQAKRKLDMTSVKAATAQWVAQVRDGDPDPERLRLVVAGAEASGDVKLLRKALKRNRRELAGAFTKSEHRVLEKLRRYLSELPAETLELVLRCAVVWIADLEESNDLAARLGQALMEPGIVAAGEGQKAWGTLRNEARDLAAQRFGVTLADLIALFGNKGLSLTEDGEGLAAARSRERQTKLDAYRGRVRERGESLDLGVLGAALPPIPLDEVDASVSVYEVPRTPSADEESHNGGLPWALRRRGRALLLGLPGSGKSVALRAAAAHYAARPDWPLPILVSLQRVGGRLDAMGFDAALLDVAFENEPVEDQPVLRAAAAELLRSGDAAIFLDALDESRSASQRIVGGLRGELNQCDPAVEVLVSTRDATYAHARTLKFKDLRLSQPDRPEATVAAVLKASAAEQRLDGEDRRAWVRVRQEWVRARLDADAELRETPLMVVLLTLVAADHVDGDFLPKSRAGILRQVIDDVVGRWETGHRIVGQPVRLGGLEGGEAVLAAKEAFVVIGSRVYEDEGAAVEVLIESLAERVRERFDVSPASAEIVADAALALWDEAGVFIGSGGDRRIQTRIQLFAELARAVAICQRPALEQREWAFAEAAAGEESQPLLLAAGLSGEISAALAEWAIADPLDSRRIELCREMIDQGARLEAPKAQALIDRLLEDQEADGSLLWQRAVLLARLPVGPQKQADALASLDCLNETQLLLARVLAIEGWPRDDDGVEEDLIALLEADPDRFRATSGPLSFLSPDPAYEEAMLVAGRRLVAVDRSHVAKLLANRMGSAVSMRTGEILRRILLENGLSGVVADADRELSEKRVAGRDYAAIFQEDQEAERRLVEIIAELAPPAELDRGSRRRLDRLVALVGLSGYNQAPAGEAARGILRDKGSLAPAFRVAIERAGFDLGQLAAEAAGWLRMYDEEIERDRFGPIFMLGDGGVKLDLGSWDRVSEAVETAEVLASAVASPYQWIGAFSARCLVGVRAFSAAREAALTVLRERLEQTTAAPQRMVALCTALISEESLVHSFADDGRPMVRRAAARLAVDRGADALPLLVALLGDRDAGVRKEAAVTVDELGLGDRLNAELEAAAEGAEGWQCFWCGADNGPETGRCSECGLSGSLLGVPPPEPLELMP
ncbi:MAG TPA: hypothetical protein VFS54_01235 [Solirubrobacterales bacterium]|nr:hypothetical protein [Solirubrobacterales bacterium]